MNYRLTPDQLVKMASQYEARAELESKAWIPAVIGIAMLAAPFITVIVDQVRTTGEIGTDVDKVLSNLNEYKKSYGFDKYDSQFTEFMTMCQQLKDSFNSIKTNSDPANPELISNINKFMSSSAKVEQLGFAIKGYLDEMKGIGGKTFDIIKSFKFNLGMDTAATAAGDAVDALYKHISMARPKIEASYKELGQKVQEAQQGEQPVQKQKESPKSIAPKANDLEDLSDITF